MWRVPAHATSATRAQVWLDGLDDWSWPGSGGAAAMAADVLPPPWVPALPPPLRAGGSDSGSPTDQVVHRPSAVPALLLAVLAALGAMFALHTHLSFGHLLGFPQPRRERAAHRAQHLVAAQSFSLRPLPALDLVSRNEAGSSIEHAGFPSVSVHGQGGFVV